MKRSLFFLVALILFSGIRLQAQGKHPFVDKGYAGNVELGVLVHATPYGTVSTMHGYSFGHGWFMGVGGMFETPLKAPAEKAVPELPEGATAWLQSTYPYEGLNVVKLFFVMRKTFSLSRTDLYIDVKGGGGREIGGEGYPTHFIRPSVGWVLGRRFSLSAGVDLYGGPYCDGTDAYVERSIALPYFGLALNF